MDKLIVIGICVSQIFFELTGLSPGGIVSPLYFAQNIMYPKRIAATLALSLGVFLLLRAVDPFVILYGRRRMSFCIIAGVLLHQLLVMIPGLPISPYMVIGYIVPGLVARDFDRQGIPQTLVGLAVATLITHLLVMVLS